MSVGRIAVDHSDYTFANELIELSQTHFKKMAALAARTYTAQEMGRIYAHTLDKQAMAAAPILTGAANVGKKLLRLLPGTGKAVAGAGEAVGQVGKAVAGGMGQAAGKAVAGAGAEAAGAVAAGARRAGGVAKTIPEAVPAGAVAPRVSHTMAAQEAGRPLTWSGHKTGVLPASERSIAKDVLQEGGVGPSGLAKQRLLDVKGPAWSSGTQVGTLNVAPNSTIVRQGAPHRVGMVIPQGPAAGGAPVAGVSSQGRVAATGHTIDPYASTMAGTPPAPIPKTMTGPAPAASNTQNAELMRRASVPDDIIQAASEGRVNTAGFGGARAVATPAGKVTAGGHAASAPAGSYPHPNPQLITPPAPGMKPGIGGPIEDRAAAIAKQRGVPMDQAREEAIGRAMGMNTAQIKAQQQAGGAAAAAGEKGVAQQASQAQQQALSQAGQASELTSGLTPEGTQRLQSMQGRVQDLLQARALGKGASPGVTQAIRQEGARYYGGLAEVAAAQGNTAQANAYKHMAKQIGKRGGKSISEEEAAQMLKQIGGSAPGNTISNMNAVMGRAGEQAPSALGAVRRAAPWVVGGGALAVGVPTAGAVYGANQLAQANQGTAWNYGSYGPPVIR